MPNWYGVVCNFTTAVFSLHSTCLFAFAFLVLQGIDCALLAPWTVYLPAFALLALVCGSCALLSTVYVAMRLLAPLGTNCIPKRDRCLHDESVVWQILACNCVSHTKNRHCKISHLVVHVRHSAIICFYNLNTAMSEKLAISLLAQTEGNVWPFFLGSQSGQICTEIWYIPRAVLALRLHVRVFTYAWCPIISTYC